MDRSTPLTRKDLRSLVLASAAFKRIEHDFNGEPLSIREPTVQERGEIYNAAISTGADGKTTKVNAAEMQVLCALKLVEFHNGEGYERVFDAADAAMLRAAPAGSPLGKLCEAAVAVFGGKDDPKESLTASQSLPA